MKKLLYALALVAFGLSSAAAQDYKVGNTYSDVYESTYTQTSDQQVSTTYSYALNYSITYQEDFTLKIDAAIKWGSEGIPVGAESFMYVSINGAEIGGRTIKENEPLITNDTFESGVDLKIGFKLPVAWGAVEPSINYIVGSTNETSKSTLGLTADVQNITKDSAEVNYTVSLPEEYDGANVSVSFNNETKSTSTGTFDLTGLNAGQKYTYNLTATAELVGQETLTKSIEVSFETLRDPSQEIHNYQITNGFLENAYLYGETPDQKRNIPISFKTDLIYNADGTITANFTITGHERVIGFVAEINVEDFSGALQPIDGIYTFTTSKSIEKGKRILPFFYPQYDGGAKRIELPWITVGDTNDPVEYGTPVAGEIYSDRDELSAKESVAFCAYLVDENGNFILDGVAAPTFTLEDNTADAEISGNFITLNKKGSATLVATFDGIVATKTYTVPFEEGTVNIVYGKTPQGACDDAQNLAKATDGNEESEVFFPCSETENHYFTIDFEGEYAVELIKLVWEGAAPTVYTVELKNGEEVVYTNNVTDGEYGGGLTIRKNFEINNTPATSITVTTQKAGETAWGIKLKEIEVYGTEYESSYYLVGTLTTNEGLPDGYPNPSFQFVKSTQDDTTVYTLEVASVTADDSFYVQRGTTIYGSSENSSSVSGMVPNESNPTLTAGENGKLFLDGSYVNVTFTLTPDANNQNLLTLTFTGTLNTDFAVTVGNDKTEQSGNVTEDTIILDTKNEYASIFVYSKDPVYYYTTEVTETNKVKALAEEAYEAATLDNKYSDGAYMISLRANTTGTLVLATKAEGATSYTPQKTYTYTVNFSTPTGVEDIDADSADAEYYTLQGVKVANPENGIFIKVAGGKAVKVIL